jgi:lysophospholipase L1-like esterase
MDVFSPVHTEEDRRALLRRFFPSVPQSFRSNPVWEIALNSRGFRDAEFPETKPASSFRIICLGDSWTFGANVGQNEAYPQRLQSLLKEEFPYTNFEVFNMGVLGYASYNGLQLLKTEGIDLRPDLVVLGFAMNEPKMMDSHASRGGGPAAGGQSISRVLGQLATFVSENVEIYRLLQYWALLIKWNPWPLEKYLKNMISVRAWYDQDWELENLDPKMQVSLRNFEEHYLEMISIARSHDIAVILLFNDFWRESPYLRILQRIANTQSVPLVVSSDLLAKEQERMQRDLESKLDLQSPEEAPLKTDNNMEVIFRVYVGDRPVPKAIYITGAHPQLNDFTPNSVPMYDDGTHGDQKAGDKVWSYSVHVSPGASLYYLYTNSGQAGRWEGLDVPALRQFKVEPKNTPGRVYAPIDTFGQLYMYADPWHTNAAGNELIARALLETLKNEKRVKRYLNELRPAQF